MKPKELRGILAGVAVFFFLSGGALAQQEVTVLGMAWSPSPVPALVVSASGALAYKEVSGAAERWILEFPGARLGQPVESVAEPQAGLKGAFLTSDENGVIRLVLELANSVQPKIRPLPAGLEIQLTGAKSVPQENGREEIKVIPEIASEGVVIRVIGGGPLSGKAFRLDNPPRVAVDIPGILPIEARRLFPVGVHGIQRVRVAQFAVQPKPIVRVAVDLDSPLPYSLNTSEEGAILRLGQAVAGRQEDEVVASSTPPLPEGVPSIGLEEEQSAQAGGENQALAAPTIPVAEVPAPQPKASQTHEDTALQPPIAPQGDSQQKATMAAPTSVVDSPYTSTPEAMTEKASPQPVAVAGAKEVESQERQFTGEPISLELKDADIKDVLRSFAKITGLNIVVDPDVTGSVTVNLENVPWDQALDIILRINRLDYVIENNVLRVARLERLTQEKTALAEYQKQAEAARPMRTVTKTLSYARAEDVKAILTAEKFIVSERGSVVVDPRSNMLIIRDLADRMDGILNLIDELDHPNPQVLIEARIVETTRTFSHALGVQWGFAGVADAQHGTTTGWRFPNSGAIEGQVGLAVQGPTGTLSLAFADILNAFNLDFTLQAAESKGLAKVVSAPKVMAQDNEAAKVESGLQIPIASTVTQGTTTTTTVTFKDATIKLEVTPHITAEGTVQLTIKLDKTEVVEGVNIVAIGTAATPGAPLTVRKAETKVLVRDGGTTVIAGVYKTVRNEQRNAVPGLSKIPVVGNLFKQRQLKDNNDELLIFLTPRIVKY